MATQCLINFPEFSESKEFLKIGRSEVCVWGGVLKVGLLNCPYLYIQGGQVMRLCGFWAYFRIFMRLFLLCGYAVTRIISFLDLPLFAKIPLILPNLSHFSLTIGFTFVISLAIQSIRSICESLFITLIIFLRILPTNAQLFCYITYIFLLFCVNYRFISGYNGINDCTENFNIFVDL